MAGPGASRRNAGDQAQHHNGVVAAGAARRSNSSAAGFAAASSAVTQQQQLHRGLEFIDGNDQQEEVTLAFQLQVSK